MLEVRGIILSSIVTVTFPGAMPTEPWLILLPFFETICRLIGYCLIPEMSHVESVLQPVL